MGFEDGPSLPVSKKEMTTTPDQEIAALFAQAEKLEKEADDYENRADTEEMTEFLLSGEELEESKIKQIQWRQMEEKKRSEAASFQKQAERLKQKTYPELTEVSFEEAERIMGRLFCGPRQIHETLGDYPETIPPIPFLREELLRAKELGQRLILYTDKLANGTKLTASELRKLTGNETFRSKLARTHKSWMSRVPEPELFLNQDAVESRKKSNVNVDQPEWYEYAKPQSQETPRTAWRFTEDNPLEKSLGKNYLEQTEVIIDYLRNNVFRGEAVPEEYEVAIREFEERKENLISRSLNKKDRLRVVMGEVEADYELADLAVNQIFRERYTETLYRLVLVEQASGEKGLESSGREDVSTWTNSHSFHGDLINIEGWSEKGLRVDSYQPANKRAGLGVCFSRSAPK